MSLNLLAINGFLSLLLPIVVPLVRGYRKPRLFGEQVVLRGFLAEAFCSAV